MTTKSATSGPRRGSKNRSHRPRLRPAQETPRRRYMDIPLAVVDGAIKLGG